MTASRPADGALALAALFGMTVGGILWLVCSITPPEPETAAEDVDDRAAADMVADCEAWLRGQGY